MQLRHLLNLLISKQVFKGCARVVKLFSFAFRVVCETRCLVESYLQDRVWNFSLPRSKTKIDFLKSIQNPRALFEAKKTSSFQKNLSLAKNCLSSQTPYLTTVSGLLRFNVNHTSVYFHVFSLRRNFRVFFVYFIYFHVLTYNGMNSLVLSLINGSNVNDFYVYRWDFTIFQS